MPSFWVKHSDALVAITFTVVVAAVGAISAYPQTRYWPGSHGIASCWSAIAMSFFAVVVGNLSALIVAGVVLCYKLILRRDSPPLFGIYVTTVNVILILIVWIIPDIF